MKLEDLPLLRILVIEDSNADYDLLTWALEDIGLQFTSYRATEPTVALAWLHGGRKFDLILTNAYYQAPDEFWFFPHVRAILGPDVPPIVVHSRGPFTGADKGASGFISKGHSEEYLEDIKSTLLTLDLFPQHAWGPILDAEGNEVGVRKVHADGVACYHGKDDLQQCTCGQLGLGLKRDTAQVTPEDLENAADEFVAMTEAELQTSAQHLALFMLSLTFDYGVKEIKDLPGEDVVMQSQAGGMTAMVKIKDLRRILVGLAPRG